MAKFGVNVVVLVDNMPLVFFYFSPKPFKKKFLYSLYHEKKIRTKLPTKKKNSCRGNFSTPLPGYLMVHPLFKSCYKTWSENEVLKHGLTTTLSTPGVTVIWVPLWFAIVYPHTHITRDMSIPSNMAVVFCVSPKNHPCYIPSSLVIQDSGLQN